VKLRRRALASKARRARSDGGRCVDIASTGRAGTKCSYEFKLSHNGTQIVCADHGFPLE
jgi:hypothetical protein